MNAEQVKDLLTRVKPLMKSPNHLSANTLAVILKVDENPKGIVLSRIAEYLEVSNAAVTGIIQNLVDAGVVKLKRGEHVDGDRRKVYALPTVKLERALA